MMTTHDRKGKWWRVMHQKMTISINKLSMIQDSNPNFFNCSILAGFFFFPIRIFRELQSLQESWGFTLHWAVAFYISRTMILGGVQKVADDIWKRQICTSFGIFWFLARQRLFLKIRAGLKQTENSSLYASPHWGRHTKAWVCRHLPEHPPGPSRLLAGWWWLLRVLKWWEQCAWQEHS